MSCPTCDHTLACLIISDMERCFQCERCGTTIIERRKQFDAPFTERVGVFVPKLVGRCREFYAEATKHTTEWDKAILLPNWNRLGIAESINLPGDRPSRT